MAAVVMIQPLSLLHKYKVSRKAKLTIIVVAWWRVSRKAREPSGRYDDETTATTNLERSETMKVYNDTTDVPAEKSCNNLLTAAVEK